MIWVAWVRHQHSTGCHMRACTPASEKKPSLHIQHYDLASSGNKMAEASVASVVGGSGGGIHVTKLGDTNTLHCAKEFETQHIAFLSGAGAGGGPLQPSRVENRIRYTHQMTHSPSDHSFDDATLPDYKEIQWSQRSFKITCRRPDVRPMGVPLGQKISLTVCSGFLQFGGLHGLLWHRKQRGEAAGVVEGVQFIRVGAMMACMCGQGGCGGLSHRPGAQGGSPLWPCEYGKPGDYYHCLFPNVALQLARVGKSPPVISVDHSARPANPPVVRFIRASMGLHAPCLFDW